MKKLLLLFLILTISVGCAKHSVPLLTPEEVQASISNAENSKLILVDVYHDHCGTCKLIDPVFHQVKDIYSGNKEVSFLKYDLSTPASKAQSLEIANKLEIGDIYKAQRFSGIVLFINAENKEIIRTLVAKYDIADYEEAITKTLGQLSGATGNLEDENLSEV